MHFTAIILAAVLSVAVGSYIPPPKMHHHHGHHDHHPHHHHDHHHHDHHHDHHHAQPYKFGYSVKDHHGEQHREESGDGQNVRGSYGFTDNRGIHRQVNYVADHAGFRAQVQTNEPGTANQNPAAVHMMSSAHPGPIGYGIAAGITGGYGHVPVVAAPVPVMGHMGQGYQYNAPLHGGYVSVYDNRHGMY